MLDANCDTKKKKPNGAKPPILAPDLERKKTKKEKRECEARSDEAKNEFVHVSSLFILSNHLNQARKTENIHVTSEKRSNYLAGTHEGLKNVIVLV